MSKACATEEEANATIEHYRRKDGTECHFEKKDGKFLIYRTSDSKTLKSINYSPADLDRIVNS